MRDVSGRQQLQFTVGLPAAALAGWAKVITDSMGAWQRLVDCQFALLKQQQELILRSHNYIARGPDWTDHYGRRNRDVDVERV